MIAVPYRAMRRNNIAQHPCIASVPSGVVEPCVARTLSVVLEPKLPRSKPQNPGSIRYSQVRTWEERGMNSRMLFCSVNFEESRVTYGSEDSGDLSLRDACLGEPRSTNKRSFISSDNEVTGQTAKWAVDVHTNCVRSITTSKVQIPSSIVARQMK